MQIKTNKFIFSDKDLTESKSFVVLASFKIQIFLFLILLLSTSVYYLALGVSFDEFVKNHSYLVYANLFCLIFFLTFSLTGYRVAKKPPAEGLLGKNLRKYIFGEKAFIEEIYNDKQKVQEVEIDWDKVKKIFKTESLLILYLESSIFLKSFSIPLSSFKKQEDVEELALFLKGRGALKNHNNVFSLINATKKGFLWFVAILVLLVFVIGMVGF